MKKIKGILFVSCLSLISLILSSLFAPYFKLEALTIGIVLGIIFINNFKLNDSYKAGIQFCQKKLLKVGIVLLGFKMSAEGIKVLGVKSIVLVVFYIISAIMLSLFLGKQLKLRKKTALLIGLGSSICGASAVVALSDSIKAETEDTALAVSVVSLLGAIGVLLYTFIFQLGQIEVVDYGMWSGLSLHGVAHAIAAAGAGGPIAKEVGTMIKLIRVLMLVPVSLVLSKTFKSDNERAKMPKYVLGFCIASVFGILNILPKELIDSLLFVSDKLILLAMSGLGLSVEFKLIKSQAKRSIIMGSILFGILSLCSLVIIKII